VEEPLVYMQGEKVKCFKGIKNHLRHTGKSRSEIKGSRLEVHRKNKNQHGGGKKSGTAGEEGGVGQAFSREGTRGCELGVGSHLKKVPSQYEVGGRKIWGGRE